MRIPRYWITIVLIVAAGVFPSALPRPEDVRVHRLANGLKILLLEDHRIPCVALYTFFRVGSRNERPGITGVSHFIEHMMFNGTAKIGPGEFDRRMEMLGGSNNAYTNEDLTAYTDWFPAEILPDMIAMEADRMQGLRFVPEVLESERGVVASERRLSVDNNNEGLLAEAVRATAIMAHPYHWDVIGWMSDIQGWRRAEIVAYYRAYYAPNNAVLVLAGDFVPEKALRLIRKHYEPIPAAPAPAPVATVEPQQQGIKRVNIVKAAQAPSFAMAFHVPGCADPDFLPLELLDRILFHGESSRLYRRLVRQEQLATAIWGGIGDSIDPFLFTINVKPRPGVDPGRLEAVVREELDAVRREGVSPEEFQKAVNMIQTRFFTGLQTIADKADALGRAEIFYGGYEKLFTRLEGYAKLSPADLQAAAGKYFGERNLTVGTLTPEGGAQ